jgi:hypothetical protein
MKGGRGGGEGVTGVEGRKEGGEVGGGEEGSSRGESERWRGGRCGGYTRVWNSRQMIERGRKNGGGSRKTALFR